MGKLYDLLREDYRVKEGLKTCINCGTCTAICPAAEFYRYDPRRIVDTVQRGNDEDIEALLKSREQLMITSTALKMRFCQVKWRKVRYTQSMTSTVETSP